MIHAGEWDGPRSVRAALDCGARRIGHGTRSIEDEDLVDTLTRDRITLEVCPTSNVFTGMFQNFGDVPVRKLFDRGVPITLSSDDPAAFNSHVAEEYDRAEGEFSFSPEEMETLRLNAIDGSFLPSEQKLSFAQRVVGGST